MAIVVILKCRGPLRSTRSTRSARRITLGVLLCLAGTLPPWAVAHEIRPAIATVTLTSDNRYHVNIVANMEAVLAGISPVHADTKDAPNARDYDRLRALAPEPLAARIREFAPSYLAGVGVEIDGRPVTPSLHSVVVPPQPDLSLARFTSVSVDGDIPVGAREIRVRYAATYGSVVVRFQGTDGDVVASWLKDGAWSEPYPLKIGVKLKSGIQVALEYTRLGFTHIMPLGLDHILFVLGLFLLSTHWRPLLLQVTAFTVAHSITLALTIYGVFSLPSTVVEPLIAASIAYVAVENVLTTELKPWRIFVVFGFGLLHGMGFAGVLREIGLPRPDFLLALVTFNLGVEFGQLAVLTLAFLLVGFWATHQSWYRARVAVPASMAIALTGFYWTVERLIG